MEQVPDLLERVNNGEREFVPTVSEVAQVKFSKSQLPIELAVWTTNSADFWGFLAAVIQCFY